MSHTIRDKARLLTRVRRIGGQVQALERALESEQGCAQVLHQIAAIRGATGGLMTQVLEEHIREHVADPALSERLRKTGADELIAVLRAYVK